VTINIDANTNSITVDFSVFYHLRMRTSENAILANLARPIAAKPQPGYPRIKTASIISLFIFWRINKKIKHENELQASG